MSKPETTTAPLKACPLCGLPPKSYSIGSHHADPETQWLVTCANTDCGGAIECVGRNQEHAEGLWNHRPTEAALREEVEALKAERRWVPVEEALPELTETMNVDGAEWPSSEAVVGKYASGNLVSQLVCWVELGNRARWLVMRPESGDFHVECAVSSWCKIL